MAWIDLWPVVILLGIMILIHELGHYWAAVSVGIRVDTFSIGFGPRLFGFRRGDTDFRVSAIPLGGYVRMYGELPGDEAASDPRSFMGKARWQRAIVVIAGPLMNVILAVAVMTGLYMYAFPKEVDPADPVITSVNAGSPAASAGIQSGDRLIQIGSHRDPNWEDVINEAALNANHPLHVVLNRKGQRIETTVTPEMDAKQGIGVAGWNAEADVELGEVMKDSPAEAAGLRKGDVLVSVNHQAVVSTKTVVDQVVHSDGKPVQVIFMRHGELHQASVQPKPTGDSAQPWRIGVGVKFHGEIVKLSFVPALVESARWNERNATLIFDALGSLVERRVSPKSLQGPIGIARMSTEAVQQGWLPYLGLMAAVSLNLAVINLMPIPILDGGTLLMLIVEMLLQREVSMQVKENVFKVGFVFLMMLVVFVIYNDISKIFTKG